MTMSYVKGGMVGLKNNGQVWCRVVRERMHRKLCCVRGGGVQALVGMDWSHAIIRKEAAEENKKVWIPVWIIASSIFIS